ncbi:MAG TPA: alpha/beta hydrolase [Acidobacteriota bacterium]|nr:alpha/beta hydrolase [Acidobacteriota bacterium]
MKIAKPMIAGLTACLGFLLPLVRSAQAPPKASSFKTVIFSSKDGLQVTADLYLAHPSDAPFIVFFHQARGSRGEYRMIAPELNAFGFNAMAVDQRIGGSFNAIKNETARRFGQEGTSEAYLDALPDMEAAVKYARKNYAKGKLIIWGSSYSASLALKIAGDYPDLVDGVLAFSPGEYFAPSGKGLTFIRDSARKIAVPVFIASSSSEKNDWYSIYEAIPGVRKANFLPASDGAHGSSALFEYYDASKDYWKAVKDFLRPFLR